MHSRLVTNVSLFGENGLFAKSCTRKSQWLTAHRRPGLGRQIHDDSQPSSSSSPTFMPKPTINVKHIRQNAELYSKNCEDRGYGSQAQSPFKIAELWSLWEDLQKESRSIRQASNRLRTKLSHSKTFSGLEDGEPGREGDRDATLNEAKSLKAQLQDIERRESNLQDNIDELAIAIPNLTSDETPKGVVPKVLGYINEERGHQNTCAEGETEESAVSTSRRAGIWRSHVHIGAELDLLDFSSASNSSGWGWYYLRNEAALLEMALVQYATSIAKRHGFTIVSPPSMVYQHIAAACGFQPRDTGADSQIYHIGSENTEEAKLRPTLVMAGTAEIPFASMRAFSDIEEAELPVLVAGSSRCYRAEAGAHGTSTKGLYRVHEFTKVEMFGWTRPDPLQVNTLFDKMVSIQTEILGPLGLYCRVLEQPSSDLGASATRKQDIEAWFPSRQDKDGGWGEVTSTSICTDYQTRRLSTRMRKADGKKAWPYTVNGTALAVPRVLAAILETHWNENEGCVRIPEVLWPFMHGVKEIRKRQNDI